MAKEVMEFYDVLSKKKFKTDEYRIEKRTAKGRDRFFAVAKSQVGTHECWKVLGKDKAAELQKAA
ncbi:MAG: hypothetical protein A2365_04350 [Candidatus Nealsonbacteria bacterium RIFOXYB1_FULL_40_15]|uniref:Uncharacterized protein n=2 Tax=Candidatus Nealsoniibacteriota TaxID=1817911 RepID=A0A1G2EN24_9BACT|nr:MAG: hypothetical protein A2427_04165 [Candidatus Nealsonbacteria bacterium RIFOXYC1_FULL_40_7]OGZ27833.1 MAG: hypothetical protein A2365_04350 [Candidatus Nealsonbacteria bacterium RIFOXYB1_FULL_40_15]OGZ28915.1 MAG: hypothetical protein A2562_04020 [Candidatus Nealsonbacteria bacterium RIFOXYD1_FULL_39_11]